MSSALSPKIIPVKPPVIKVETVPIANNIAVVNLIFPFQRVVKKLKTLTADGIAISNVVIEFSAYICAVNLWNRQIKTAYDRFNKLFL